ncbi:MAG: NUDIX domain-containing protein [Candidatus Saccharimonadales bacterium]
MPGLIQVVDEYDNPIGTATIAEAQEKSLYHRIARVVLEDENGNILLQKRTMQKGTYPGCWDNSAAGHVDAGESYEVAAARELKEELGIEVALTERGKYAKNFVYKEAGKPDKALNRFHAVYSATIPHDTKFTLQAEEVDEVKWFTVDEIKGMLKNSPEIITQGVGDVMERYYENYGDSAAG